MNVSNGKIILHFCLFLFYYPPRSRVRVAAVIVFDDEGLFSISAMSGNMTNDF